MRLFRNSLLALLLFACLSLPVLADDGQGQVVYPGGSLVVESGDVVRDDVVALGGSLDVREGGRVDGDVTLLGGSAKVDGQVDGNLVVIGGSLDLGAHAVVDGDLVTLGGTTTKSAQATVRGQTTEGLRGRFPDIEIRRLVPPPAQWTDPWRWGEGGSAGWFGRWLQVLVSTMGMMALGLLLVSVLPKQTSLIVETVEQSPVVSFGVGLLTMIVLPMVLILLVVICIGIPIAVLLAMAAVAAGAYGWVAVGVASGQRLLVALRSPSGPALGAIVGVGLLSLFSAVPCLGWLLGLIAAAMGLGAVVLTRFGTLRYAHGREGLAVMPSATGPTLSDGTAPSWEQEAGPSEPNQAAPVASAEDSAAPQESAQGQP